MHNAPNTSSMENNVSKQLNYGLAYKRVMMIKDFYMRLTVYCGINLMLLIVWLVNPDIATNFWIPTCFFTTVVAGFLVLANAINLYGQKYMLPKKWEERKMKELMNNENQTITKYE